MLACLVVGYWAGIAVRVQIESWNSWPLSGRWLHVTSGRCTLRRTLVTRDIHQKPSPTLTESVALERIADRVQLLLSRCVRAPDSILQFYCVVSLRFYIFTVLQQVPYCYCSHRPMQVLVGGVALLLQTIDSTRQGFSCKSCCTGSISSSLHFPSNSPRQPE
jgi:hypothetical protein